MAILFLLPAPALPEEASGSNPWEGPVIAAAKGKKTKKKKKIVEDLPVEESEPVAEPVEPESAPLPTVESTVPAVPQPVEEEITDFAEEEAVAAVSGQQSQTPAGPPALGVKIIADLLAEHIAGSGKFEFKPNHSLVLLQVSLDQEKMFVVHISDDPTFYELNWNLTPRLRLRIGKILVPFGINEFHHIIGGRVDQASAFLPETWGDHGLGINHFFYDGSEWSAEYDLYTINGFQGTEAPVVAAGKGVDNNFNKGLGTRLKATWRNKYAATGSLYYDVWDPDDTRALVFYAVGVEARPGFIPGPMFNRLSLRGEWSRGEIRLPGSNEQRGLLEYNHARTGFFAEAKYGVLPWITARFRSGFLNPDNTVADANDVWVYEPACIFGSGKLTFHLAWQFTRIHGSSYSRTDPPDVGYAKFFLQY